MQLVIDGSKFQSKEELHEFIKKELHFPDYYGANLDALYDSLGDIEEDLFVKLINMDNFKGFLRVFTDASLDYSHIKLID